MTDQSELVERVARALNSLWCPTCEPYEMTDDAHRAYCEKSARAAIAAMGDGWQDIASAPKDGTRVLLLMKDPIPRENRPDLEGFAGVQFVGRCHTYEDGTNIGWGFAAPVGCGGLPDDWMVGWRPLPPPPAQERKP